MCKRSVLGIFVAHHIISMCYINYLNENIGDTIKSVDESKLDGVNGNKEFKDTAAHKSPRESGGATADSIQL